MTLRVPTVVACYPWPATVVLVLLVASLDYASGLEITFVELMYLVPLAFATWFRGRSAGLATAAAAAAITTAITGDEISTHAAVLNGLGALGIYAVFVWLLAALQVHVEREAERLRGVTDQLRHAERLNVLGVLAAGVAHELGTPLNVISGAAEMLEEDPGSPARTRELSRTVLNQTTRITAIVQNLLDFARRGGNALTKVKPAIELQVAVSTAVDLLAATARKRGTTIELVEGAPSLAVRANRQEVEQVVSNLILNGIQAMPHGGHVTVETRSEQHPGRDGRPRTFGTIVVEDQGRGIAESDLPHIFDPFFTTKDVGEGTGLGLSVTYGIVTDLGGMIDVATEIGRGTRFVVRLPLA